MRYQYKEEWYENLSDVPKPSGTADSCAGTVKLARRGVVTTLASLALCVAASYMAGGIIGGGTLAADAAISGLPSASAPMKPSDADASYVMSWVYDDGMGGGRDDTDDSDGGDDSTGEEVKDGGTANEHDEHISELANAYIAAHTPGVGTE